MLSSPHALPERLQPWVDAWSEPLLAAVQAMITASLALLAEEGGVQEGDVPLHDLLLAHAQNLQVSLRQRLAEDLSPPRQHSTPGLDADSMQLLDQQDMEEEVVAHSLVSRWRIELATPLQQWREVLLAEWQERQWPGSRALAFDPDTVMLHGLELLRRLPIDASARRRLLPIWARSVVATLRTLLPRMIADLQATGLLAVAEAASVVAHDSERSTLQLPQELDVLRQSLLPLLRSQMEAWFEDLHRAFQVHLSEGDAAEQDRLLSLVQTLKNHADGVQGRFFEAISAQFMQMQQTRSWSANGDLGLLDEQEMEWNMQMQTIAVRLRQREAAALQALAQRLQHLLPRSEGLERKMPLDPAQLMLALRQSLHPENLSAQDKIDLLFWFDKRVLDDLALLLEAANESLAEQGVLPELPRRQIIKGVSPGPVRRKEASAKPAMLAEEDVHRLQAVLQLAPGSVTPVEADGRVIGRSLSAVPLAPEVIPAGAEQTTVSAREVLAMLSRLQQDTSTRSLAQDASSPSVSDVRTALRSQLRQDDQEVQTVRRADEEVINLVSMIFDFILDDEELPTPMKALLGRLQIPLLKVAMLDERFFSPDEHPARSLLNMLARAGMGWSDVGEQDNRLYQRIEQVVFRIINEFHDDVRLFEELLHDFSEFYTQQQHRQDLVEKRTREAEEGRARAEMARAMVQQTLARRLRGRPLPAIVLQVLQEGWTQVLYLACLRQGVDSDAWKQATKVADALIWLAQPGDASWRERAIALQDRILASLRKGLQSAAVEPQKVQAWMDELTRGILQQSREDSGWATTVAEIAVEEPAPVVAVERDAFNDLVEALPVGAWVERLEQDPADRCKLVARIRLVDKLVFTNQRGIKAIEITSADLAAQVRAGRWRLLDKQGRVFDRALDTVVGALRRRQTRAA